MTDFPIVRTRFAPSPTGYLHVGGARTALFAWLYARHYDGQFILRIEDTDRERSTDTSLQAILDGMHWMGLDYDEGPFYQTKRFDRYKEVISQLLDKGLAYRCCCSKDRLASLREEQLNNKIKPRYDRHCLDNHVDPNQPFVIRFKNPQEGDVTFNDLIKGPITISNSELDDLIIARQDGTPTYNLSVVVDDWDMQISHVIRGDDHINNTPRQINLFNALGAPLPQFAHVPMILGADGKRLSKRHGAVSVLQYRDHGFLKEALLNYLVRLGWAHKDQEIFSIPEMIKLFSLSACNRSASIFDPEKLAWLNQHYLKELPVNDLVTDLALQFERAGVETEGGPPLAQLMTAQATRCKTMAEVVAKSLYFYQDFAQFDQKAALKNLKTEYIEPLRKILKSIDALADWDQDALHQIVIQTAEHYELKLGKLAQAVRVAITGNTISPPLDATLYLIGRKRVMARLLKAINFISSRSELS